MQQIVSLSQSVFHEYSLGVPSHKNMRVCRGTWEVQWDSETLLLLVPPPQFTNCSVCLTESIYGKCKVSQLPCDLAARVKVGDVYKMVCILPAWEIKRLAKSRFQRSLPTGGRVALFPFCCAEKGVHEHTQRQQRGNNGNKSLRLQYTSYVTFR